MADKKKRTVKRSETLRERSQKEASKSDKPTKRRRVVKTASKPIKGASKAGRKEYHPFKLPDNKFGRRLNKRAHIMPKYFREAWEEIKQVEWPDARETTKLTTAVIVFALVLGAVVYVLDFGLNKIFREVLLG
ncbi:MAG: preprotein translocase subunit SecE [Candidatus Saccharibacteria bacterium]|nr:preprotein translocase subunit SecE [Candidatus Saccharibacteria bacterium]